MGDARIKLKQATVSLGNKKQMQEVKEKLRNLLNDNVADIHINVDS